MRDYYYNTYKKNNKIKGNEMKDSNQRINGTDKNNYCKRSFYVEKVWAVLCRPIFSRVLIHVYAINSRADDFHKSF